MEIVVFINPVNVGAQAAEPVGILLEYSQVSYGGTGQQLGGTKSSAQYTTQYLCSLIAPYRSRRLMPGWKPASGKTRSRANEIPAADT